MVKGKNVIFQYLVFPDVLGAFSRNFNSSGDSRVGNYERRQVQEHLADTHAATFRREDAGWVAFPTGQRFQAHVSPHQGLAQG